MARRRRPGGRGRRPEPKKEVFRINKRIRVKEVRVIGANGENVGVISIEEALKLAELNGLKRLDHRHAGLF